MFQFKIYKNNIVFYKDHIRNIIILLYITRTESLNNNNTLYILMCEKLVIYCSFTTLHKYNAIILHQTFKSFKQNIFTGL